MSRNFEYSERYTDDLYEYRCGAETSGIWGECRVMRRHVVLPKEYVRRIPEQRLMKEARRICIENTRGNAIVVYRRNGGHSV